MRRAAPTAKSDLAQSVSGAEDEKHGHMVMPASRRSSESQPIPPPPPPPGWSSPVAWSS